MWVPLLNETLAKTWMNGVFKPSQQPSSATASEKRKSKSNIIISASNASSSSVLTPVLRSGCFEIFFECLFCQLTTVLMNDFRLKTFYSKSSSKTNSTSATATSSTSTPTTLSTLSTSSISSNLTPSNNNNNHLRTYNNSSKSNKVFLYYTPRDPRLRIFEKTKQLSHRPQCCKLLFSAYLKATTANKQHHHHHRQVLTTRQSRSSDNSNCDFFSNNSLLKITDDLCNYGELIGGYSGENNSSGVNQQQSATITKVLNKPHPKQQIVISVAKLLLNNSNSCDQKPFNKRKENASDKCVVAAAAAIIETSLVATIVLERQLTEFLITYIGAAFLSFFHTIVVYQETTLFNVITTIVSYEKI